MGLNPRQLEAVAAQGTVAISAGAGTGKTQTMAARYLAHVEAGMRPLEVVAVTFTVRAASELRRRILEQLREKLPINDPRILEVEVAPIGTIHSLCQRICSEFPVESGLNYDFVVADETTYQQLLAQELPHLLEAVPPNTYELIDYSALKGFVASFLGDLEKFRRAMTVDIAEIKASIAAARLRVLEDGALPLFEHQLSQCEALTLNDRIEQARRVALAGLRSLLHGDDAGFGMLAAIDLRGGSAKNWIPGELTLIKDTLRALRDYLRSLPSYVVYGFNQTDEEHQVILQEVSKAVELVAAQLVELKRSRGIADFNDLELHAVQALKDDMVCRELTTRLRAILVDEVQDISPLQYELLTRLGRAASLAAVGDVKQSLYRFRGADPDLFARQIAQSAVHVTLEENYRTVPGLVEFVNHTFDGLLPEYEALSPRRTTSFPRPPVEILLVDDSSDATLTQRRQALARQIGHRIFGLLEEPFEIVDPRTNLRRQVRPHDIAIISSRWTMLDAVAEELQRVGLVANIVGGGQLLGTQEALDVLTILAFCDNPHDDLACIALMRSPMIGISDRELATLAERKGRSVSWFSFLNDELRGDPRLEALKYLPYSPTALSPSDQLAQAGDLLLYPELLARLNHHERRRADWIALLDLVDDRSREGLDTQAVIMYLRQAIADQARIRRPPIEAEDSVSLVTIHASKGLEWPITFVIDLDRSPSRSPRQLIDPHRGVAFTLNGEPSGHLSWIYEHQLREDLLEEHRRWYVATTRARDHLILGFASRSQVDELLTRVEEQFQVSQIPIDIAPATPRITPEARTARYRLPAVDLSTPSPAIRRSITSRALDDFRRCPLLLASSEPPFGPVGRLRTLLSQRARDGLSVSERDLPWMGARDARTLLQAVGGYQLQLASHLIKRPALREGTTRIGAWSIAWGPFLDDQESLIDLAFDEGDLVGLALAHAEQPVSRAGIYYLTQSRIHWLSPPELARTAAQLTSLVHELSSKPPSPREDRASVCRNCRRSDVCHWVQSQDHRL